jgi:hypothetical protein
VRIALIDPFAGIAGDMLVGALLDAGAPLAAVRRGLRGLPLDRFSVSASEVERCGVRARKYHVRFAGSHHHRGLPEILRILRRGKLPERALDRAERAFRLLAAAEARVHGIPVSRVHFHEVGAVDAICDVAGAAIALEELSIDRLFCRPLPLSHGVIVAEHGRMPVPAPATMELLKGFPTFDSGLSGEIVTPTGAACARAWAEASAPPPFVPEAIGYGAGTRDPDGYPNVCRVTVGEASEEGTGPLLELVCDVDDATPQLLGHLLGRLLEAGALDASLQPLVMKKDRPGTRITALARQEGVPALEQILFGEGTTLGVRRRRVERTELPRRVVAVRTPWGRVRVKTGTLGGKVVHAAPEYEDCRALAREAGVPR